MPSKKRDSVCSRKSSKKAFREKMAKARSSRSMTVESSEIPSTSSPSRMSSPPHVSLSTTPTTAATPISASKRKLGFLSDDDSVEGVTSTFPDTIVHLELLQGLMAGVICGHCRSGDVKICHDSSRTKGLSVGLVSICQECGDVCGRTNTSRQIAPGKSFEVNRAVVAASLNIGIGHGGISRFCEILGVPSLHAKTFQELVRVVHQHAKETAGEVTRQARAIVSEMYEPDANGVVDVAVSFDGTWHKRGHTSNHGAAVVICALTGLVLDSHFMSLHCHVCKTKGVIPNPEERRIWWEGHKDVCHVNYSGSSGGMEPEAAKILWGRSLEHQMRYVTLIGDGDSKTFNALKTLDPYEGVVIKKAECVNHVAKRLGTALRNLVITEKKRGNTLGGRGSGTLTQEKIGKLQSYYTKAVRSYNTSVEDMSNGIWAAFYHGTSSDAKPQHHLCPTGVDSWCFFQRAAARHEPVPTHTGRLTTSINPTVAAFLRPIYERLTDPVLLEKCLSGLTQNQNESFHSQIWLRCPKHIFVTRPRIEVATSLANCEWNQGSQGTLQFMKSLGLFVSSTTVSSANKRDQVRIRKAEDAAQLPAKRHRQMRKSATQREAQRRQGEEQHPYASGTGGY